MKKNNILKIFGFIFVSILFSMYIFNCFSSSIFVNAEIKDDYPAKAYFLMDYNTGEVLFEKNSQDKLPVASIVKLMTINIVCEQIENGNLDINQKVVASREASSMGGSQVFIEEGGEYSIGDLLKSTIVASANDACVLLAETISGNQDNFVKLMNEKANKLGLLNTNYQNCTGLPASNQFSCAYDTAMLLREVCKHDVYHKYSSIWMDTLSHPNDRQSEIVNTNKLVKFYQGCDGGKTGSTSEAGYCLSATAKRGNMRLIAVVLGAKDGKSRFSETSKLLDYGFNNFENKAIIDKNYFLEKEVKILKGKKDTVKIEPQKEIYVLNKKFDNNQDIKIKVEFESEIKAPISKGDKVGEILVIKNNEIINKTDIISKENIEKSNLYDYIKKLNENWKIV